MSNTPDANTPVAGGAADAGEAEPTEEEPTEEEEATVQAGGDPTSGPDGDVEIEGPNSL